MKKRKRPPILLLLTALALMLTACGAPSASLPTVNPDKTVQNTRAAETDAPQNSLPPGSTAQITSDPTVEPTPSKERFIEDLRARYSAHTPNGYSLWTKDSSLYCVDSKGYATCRLPAGEQELTNVYNGVFLTAKGAATYLRKIDGSAVFSDDKLDGAKVILLSHKGQAMFQDGYIMLCRMTESYAGASYELGFMNTNGEWLVPLSGQNPILTGGFDASVSNLKEKLYYCGEGILAFQSDEDQHSYYNIRENQTVTIKNTNYNFDSILQCDYLQFRNGICVTAYGNYYYKFNVNGETKLIRKNIHNNIHERLGSNYYDRNTDQMIIMGIQYHTDAFYVGDAFSGTIVKKIENIKVCNVTGFFSDGTAQLMIENKEGNYYYTVIDRNGNFLFEPIKTESNAVFNLNGYHIDTAKTTYHDGYFSVIDNNGNLLLKTDYVKDFYIKNGVARYEKNDETFYVDLGKCTPIQ